MKEEDKRKISDYESDLFWKKKKLEEYNNEIDYWSGKKGPGGYDKNRVGVYKGLKHTVEQEIKDIESNIDTTRFNSSFNRENNDPRSLFHYLAAGLVVFLIFMFVRFRERSEETIDPSITTVKSEIKAQLKEMYEDICSENGHMKLLSISQLDEDTYEVKLKVDNTFIVTNDVNSWKEPHIEDKWQELVSPIRVQRLARYNDITINVEQWDAKGEYHITAEVSTWTDLF